MTISRSIYVAVNGIISFFSSWLRNIPFRIWRATGKYLRQKEMGGRHRMKWLDNTTDSMDVNWSKLWEIVEDSGAWCAAVHGVGKSWTWFSDWTDNKYSMEYMCHIFIHSSNNEYLCCFPILAIVNSAAVKIGVHVSFWIMVFSRWMSRSRDVSCADLFYINMASPPLPPSCVAY